MWLALVAPANAQIGRWTPSSIPDDWMRWRAQWEYAHAVRALLLILGFGLLVWSAFVDARGTTAS